MFSCLKHKWKKSFVYRKALDLLTGGIIWEHMFAEPRYRGTDNLPQPSMMWRKVAYDVDDVIVWLNSLEVEIVEYKHPEISCKISQ